jgi:hypothetical protein
MSWQRMLRVMGADVQAEGVSIDHTFTRGIQDWVALEACILEPEVTDGPKSA